MTPLVQSLKEYLAQTTHLLNDQTWDLPPTFQEFVNMSDTIWFSTSKSEYLIGIWRNIKMIYLGKLYFGQVSDNSDNLWRFVGYTMSKSD